MEDFSKIKENVRQVSYVFEQNELSLGEVVCVISTFINGLDSASFGHVCNAIEIIKNNRLKGKNK